MVVKDSWPGQVSAARASATALLQRYGLDGPSPANAAATVLRPVALSALIGANVDEVIRVIQQHRNNSPSGPRHALSCSMCFVISVTTCSSLGISAAILRPLPLGSARGPTGNLNRPD